MIITSCCLGCAHGISDEDEEEEEEDDDDDDEEEDGI